MPLSNLLPDSTDEFALTDLIPLLVADADPKVRRVLATVFSTAGYAVTCAEDGVEAREIAERQSFPLVIASVDLPKMDGVTLARFLSERDTFATCLLLALPEDLPRVLEAAEIGNVYNHFWKPLKDVGDLARAAARALEHREMRRNNGYLLSELRDARLELQTLCSRLEQLDKVTALGQMTETVAHDLEKPLAGLRAYAQYLHTRLDREDREPLTTDQVERVMQYLSDMETSVERCHTTVQSVIDYTRVQADPPGPVPLNEVISESLSLLQHSLQEQNIRLQLDFANDVAPALANPRRLQQVLVNLILNAQQAMAATGGTLTIRTEGVKEKTSGQECAVQVHITDTGSGIAPEVLPRIFDPFFTTRSDSENLGLGMTIARNIVREWQGEITVASSDSKGTTMTLTLPVCAEMAVPVRSATERETVEEARRAA